MPKHPDTVDFCTVADDYCLAPCGFGTSMGNYYYKRSDHDVKLVRTKCIACGDFVCKNCSLVIKYFSYGRKRVCHTCIENLDGNRDRIVAHIKELENETRNL